MKKQIRVIIGFIAILMAIIAIPITINASNSVSFYSPYPQGNIGINQPEIGWTVFLNGNDLKSANFYLNGKILEVEYDSTRNTFFAKPNEALSGINKVQAKIQLDNWSNIIEKSWTFTVASQSINTLPLPHEKQLIATNLANDYRYVLKLPLYQFNSSLNISAQKHADYMANLNIFDHYQTPSTSGFFGESVADRANYYGFYGDVAEDLSYQSNPSIQEAVDSLFDAPYHRIPFLIPAYQEFGYGMNKFYHVLNFGGKSQVEAKWVAYPSADSINIPIWWDNYETPNPLRLYNNAPKRVGYPIVAGIYGSDVKNVKLISANLWTEGGTQVPIYINSPKSTGGNDDKLNYEVILIPKKVLLENEKYQVSVVLEATIDNKAVTFDKNWTFTTESRAGQGKNQLHQLAEYPPLLSKTEVVQFRIGQDFIWVDDYGYPLDIAPFIENGRTMVPFRALGNSLGAEVNWNGTTKTITYQKANILIELPIDSNLVRVNGQSVLIDQGAVIRDSRSYVPSRFISEQLGAGVTWLSAKQEVMIKAK